MSQADFSDYVVHFTKDALPHSAAQHPENVAAFAGMGAHQRLVRILQHRHIAATHMPWTNQRAVCFSECTWPSLLKHCARYSKYGIGFRKSTVFARGGGPAVYVRQDHFDEQLEDGGFTSSLYAFLTPFHPSYAPAEYLANWDKPALDFSYEREWRIAGDMDFLHNDIAFVLVASHTDIAAMPPLGAAFPADKWIIVSNYLKIEELWPQQNVGGA